MAKSYLQNRGFQKQMMLWALPMALLITFLGDLLLGSVYIPVADLFRIFIGASVEDPSWEIIIWKFRLPKALTALCAGAALGISGLLMQSYFRNPLAGPFVLGVSAGASLGVALVILGFSLGGGLFLLQGFSLGVVLAAGIGAMAVMTLILFLSLRTSDPMALLIVGLMIASFTSALVGVLQYFSPGDEIRQYVLWSFGSLGAPGWNDLSILLPGTFAFSLLAFVLSKYLNAMLLGEQQALSLGLSPQPWRFLTLLTAGMLAALITAYCGPIAFIGLAVPHITRLGFNTHDHRLLIPAVAGVGAVLMLLCDIVSQLPGSSSTLPINGITSFIGAPVVIYLILKRKNLSNRF